MNDDSTATFVSNFKVTVENGQTAEFDSHDINLQMNVHVIVLVMCQKHTKILTIIIVIIMVIMIIQKKKTQ